MKAKLFAALLLYFFGFGLFSQTTIPEIERHYVTIEDGINFCVVGENSYNLIDNLLAAYPKTNRGKKYVWKFKNINISGIEEPITFQVHQGIQGKLYKHENANCEKGCAYFHTFRSNENKEEMLSKLAQNNEQCAVIIYIKKGTKFGEPNKEQAKLIEDYLKTLL